MNHLQKAFLKLLLASGGFVAVTFCVYFFNLDMKLTALIEPFLLKHYDSIEREMYL